MILTRLVIDRSLRLRGIQDVTLSALSHDCCETVKGSFEIIMTLVAHFNLYLHQIDVITAFLSTVYLKGSFFLA